MLTLTSFGMVDRSRPHGRDPSRVIALEKGPTRGVREIPLEAGAQGVPDSIDELLAAARPGAPWRAELQLPEPSARLAAAIESLGRIARAAPSPAGASSFDALLAAAGEDHPGDTALDELVRHALLSMLEERRTRQRR